jgi:beta-lactamase regulating signal transducer with metallopeptidase domain
MLPADTALTILLDLGLKSAVILTLALLGQVLIWRSSAAARHLLWASTLGATLAMPLFSLALPQWRVLPIWDNQVTATAPAPALANLEPQQPLLAHADEMPAAIENAPPSDVSVASAAEVLPTADAHAVLSPSEAVLAVWLVGVVWLLLPFVIGVFSLRRMLVMAQPVTAGSLFDGVAQLADASRIRRPRLYTGQSGAMPMVWGVTRSNLLLPQEAPQWEPARLRSVLLHELAHIQRRDQLTQALGRLARALYWYNPLAWLAVRRLRIEQECACDDYVLRDGVKPSDYAEQLLGLSALVQLPAAANAVVMAMAQGRLESRVRGILNTGRNCRGMSRRLAAASVFLAVIVAVPLAMIQVRKATAAFPAETNDPLWGEVAQAQQAATPVIAQGKKSKSKAPPPDAPPPIAEQAPIVLDNDIVAKFPNTVAALFEGIPKELQKNVASNQVRIDRVNDWLKENVDGKNKWVECTFRLQEVTPSRDTAGTYQVKMRILETPATVFGETWMILFTDRDYIGPTLGTLFFAKVKAADAEKLADKKQVSIKGKVKYARLLEKGNFGNGTNMLFSLENIEADGTALDTDKSPGKGGKGGKGGFGGGGFPGDGGIFGGINFQRPTEKAEEKPKEKAAFPPKLDKAERVAIVTAANQAIGKFLQSERKKGSDDIDAAFWGDAIAKLKPIRVRNDKVNVAIVLAETEVMEEGLYVSVPISSYAPSVGNRFTVLDRLTDPQDMTFGHLYYYKLKK